MNPYVIDEAASVLTDGGVPFGETVAGRQVIAMARAFCEAEEKRVSAPRMPVGQFVVRKEDMSQNGRLRLIKEDDGDICVAVIDGLGEMADIQFCVPGIGGGKSPRTLAALEELGLAIMDDNKADPGRAAER